MQNMLTAQWRAYLAFTSNMLETSLAVQKAAINSAQAKMPSGIPSFSLPDETQIRDSFHKAAGDNLQRWGDTADILKTLPDWYKDMAKAPGTYLTDWFDAARRGS